MPCPGHSVAEPKAPSHGLNASFGPPELDVTHCHIQPRCVSLVAATAQELLRYCLNAQMGDGEMLVIQEIFLQL